MTRTSQPQGLLVTLTAVTLTSVTLTSVTLTAMTLTSMTLTAVTSAMTPEDVCSALANPSCRCTNPSTLPPLPDIVCHFTAGSTDLQTPLWPNTTGVAVGRLDLSNTTLDRLPQALLRGVGTLQTLVLTHNRLTAVPPALAGLQVVNINMSSNRVSGLSLTVLAAIHDLRTLDLSHNCLTSLFADRPLPTGLVLSSLKELQLSGNFIDSMDSSELSTMPGLVHLDLSNNLLTQVSQATFSQLSLSLVKLDLSHNRLTHVQPLALAHLQHLRVLDLGSNPLAGVELVQFPRHLQALDLSHCTLAIINHCQLAGLADLSFIGLRGNHLTCTCQLYLLLQWYQNQHHQTGDLQADTVGSNWTCTPAPPATADPPTADPPTTADPLITTDPPAVADHSPQTGGDSPMGGMQRVMDLGHCQDTQSHCQTLEHYQHHTKGSSKLVVRLDVAWSDSSLIASWSLEENGEAVVGGFTLQYFPEDGQPLSSPLLPPDQRSFLLDTPGVEKHLLVCLDVLAYDLSLVQQECRGYKDEPSNIVVGILAGVVFILPCSIALLYILIKDRRLRALYDSKSQSEDIECLVSKHGESLVKQGDPPAKASRQTDDAGGKTLMSTDSVFQADIHHPSQSDGDAEKLVTAHTASADTQDETDLSINTDSSERITSHTHHSFAAEQDRDAKNDDRVSTTHAASHKAGQTPPEVPKEVSMIHNTQGHTPPAKVPKEDSVIHNTQGHNTQGHTQPAKVPKEGSVIHNTQGQPAEVPKEVSVIYNTQGNTQPSEVPKEGSTILNTQGQPSEVPKEVGMILNTEGHTQPAEVPKEVRMIHNTQGQPAEVPKEMSVIHNRQGNTPADQDTDQKNSSPLNEALAPCWGDEALAERGRDTAHDKKRYTGEFSDPRTGSPLLHLSVSSVGQSHEVRGVDNPAFLGPSHTSVAQSDFQEAQEESTDF